MIRVNQISLFLDILNNLTSKKLPYQLFKCSQVTYLKKFDENTSRPSHEEKASNATIFKVLLCSSIGEFCYAKEYPLNDESYISFDKTLAEFQAITCEISLDQISASIN